MNKYFGPLRRILTLACLGILSGCSERPGTDGIRFETRDSAGVQIVRSVSPLEESEWEWSVSESPTLEIVSDPINPDGVLHWNREEAKAEDRLRELAAQIDVWRESRWGKGHSEISVRRKIRQWTSREHLRDYLEVEIEVEGERVVRLDWTWDGERKRSVQRRHLGKKMIVTDQHGWDDANIVRTYRRLTRTESLFKMSKSDPGLWWPMFHWTDSKIRVHALYCFFALLLLAILRLKLREAGVTTGVGRAVERLAKMRESVVVYTNGATDRVLMELDDSQQELADALQLPALAEGLGTTVLSAD